MKIRGNKTTIYSDTVYILTKEIFITGFIYKWTNVQKQVGHLWWKKWEDTEDFYEVEIKNPFEDEFGTSMLKYKMNMVKEMCERKIRPEHVGFQYAPNYIDNDEAWEALKEHLLT